MTTAPAPPAAASPTGNRAGERIRILYLFPDRSSRAAAAWEHERFWPVYRKAAADAGLDFDVATPEHIVLNGRRAYWSGEELRPERDVIVYDIRSEPLHAADLWTSMTLVKSLETLGFWSAIPLDDALLLNDKFATAELLRDSPVPVIPSVRVTAGRDLERLGHQELVPDSWFPAFVKPASWGRGLGCVACPDRATLDAVLGLASGAGACMLVQPSVGRVVADTRVVLVEGQVVAAYDRVPGDASHVANVSRGGSVRMRASVERPVHDLAGLVQQRLGLPYVCIDLLRTDDGAIWLSELEPDGAVYGLFDVPGAVDRVVGARFRAYAARLRAHVSAAAPSSLRSGGARTADFPTPTAQERHER
jgi:hypothetical protein